jgi:hypothetical protein
MTPLRSLVLATASYVSSFTVAFALLAICLLCPEERLLEFAVPTTLTFGLLTVRMLLDAYRSGVRRVRCPSDATYGYYSSSPKSFAGPRDVSERASAPFGGSWLAHVDLRMRTGSLLRSANVATRTSLVALSSCCVVAAHVLLLVTPSRGGVLRVCLVWFAASLGTSPVALSVGAEHERKHIARSVVEMEDVARAR